ncbi:phage antirepressor KilAC domain-containing protein [Bacillus sp. FSL W7-1360]
MMNELITTKENENGQLLVSGRELHEFLEVKTAYKDWYPRMKGYGFAEGVDYVEVTQKVHAQKRARTYEQVDHHITIDMAKEISMLQRNEKGKQARQYFLDLERKWNSPEMIMKRAMDYANAQVAKLETKNFLLTQQNQEMEPKAFYFDKVMQSDSLLTVSQIAKDYGMSARLLNSILRELGVQYKQNGCWLLYSKYQNKGYTQTKTEVLYGQVVLYTSWTQEGRWFIYNLLKREKQLVPLMEREETEGIGGNEG